MTGETHYIAPPRSRLHFRRAVFCAWSLSLDRDARLKRLRFRAWHRGTKEADLLVGGFFDAHAAGWGEAEIAWFERLLEEQDADIMAWAIGSAEPPPAWAGELMRQLKRVNYIKYPE
jgi:antitoxin CptB